MFVFQFMLLTFSANSFKNIYSNSYALTKPKYKLENEILGIPNHSEKHSIDGACILNVVGCAEISFSDFLRIGDNTHNESMWTSKGDNTVQVSTNWVAFLGACATPGLKSRNFSGRLSRGSMILVQTHFSPDFRLGFWSLGDKLPAQPVAGKPLSVGLLDCVVLFQITIDLSEIYNWICITYYNRNKS